MERVLEREYGERFVELYGHLLAYVNAEYDEVPGYESYDDLTEFTDSDLRPIRNRLYEADTERLLTEFVSENPAGLDEDDLETVRGWTDYEYGEFIVVRHLKKYAVFLDWSDPPRAYGVKAVLRPFEAYWEEGALPVNVTGTALLPFEGGIVYDGWMAIRQIVFGGNISANIDDDYEEAKHRFGIIETLPAPEEDSEPSDAEELRFYMKNKRNRQQYAPEIESLKSKSERLEGIYHEELGKAHARSLGRELRDLDLNEAYFAIYDERIVASGTSEAHVQEVLDEIMPAGKESHPYIYHFDP